jgi:hypothetical protein
MDLEHATIAIAFETMAELTGRAPAVTLFLSRYPGEPEILPPAADPGLVVELYSLHVTDMGLVITYRWWWDEQAQAWDQQAPLVSETVELALEMVPAGAVEIPCPREFGLRLFEVRS